MRVRGGVGFDRVAREDEARADLSERNAGGLQQQARRAGPPLADDLRGLGGRQLVGPDGEFGRPPCRERVEIGVVERSDAKGMALLNAAQQIASHRPLPNGRIRDTQPYVRPGPL